MPVPIYISEWHKFHSESPHFYIINAYNLPSDNLCSVGGIDCIPCGGVSKKRASWQWHSTGPEKKTAVEKFELTEFNIFSSMLDVTRSKWWRSLAVSLTQSGSGGRGGLWSPIIYIYIYIYIWEREISWFSLIFFFSRTNDRYEMRWCLKRTTKLTPYVVSVIHFFHNLQRLNNEGPNTKTKSIFVFLALSRWLAITDIAIVSTTLNETQRRTTDLRLLLSKLTNSNVIPFGKGLYSNKIIEVAPLEVLSCEADKSGEVYRITPSHVHLTVVCSKYSRKKNETYNDK